MMIHRWSESFSHARDLVKTELDHRAINVCEAWIIWADPFNVAPDAALIGNLGAADAARAAVIVRQIAGKLARDCPVPMPMPLPADLEEMLDGERTVEPEAAPARADYERGPRPS